MVMVDEENISVLPLGVNKNITNIPMKYSLKNLRKQKQEDPEDAKALTITNQLQGDFRELQRLYKQEQIRSTQLNSDRVFLESNLLSKEKIIVSQTGHINTIQNLLESYKKTFNDEMNSFERDYNHWLEEKLKYKSKISSLKRIVDSNSNGEIAYTASETLLEENNQLQVEVESLKQEIKSLSKKHGKEVLQRNTLLEDVNKLNHENQTYLTQIKDLKADMDIISHGGAGFENTTNPSIKDDEEDFLDDQCSEIKYPSLSLWSSGNDHHHSRLLITTLESELKQNSNGLLCLSEELDDLRTSLASSKLENQQLLFYINQLLLDNELLKANSFSTINKEIKHELQDHVVSIQAFIGNPNSDITPPNGNSDIAPQRLQNGNLVYNFPKKTRSLSMSDSIVHSKSKGSNFKYFTKNNRISRIISNNIDSSFSISNSKKDRKLKRHTIISTVPSELEPINYMDDGLTVSLKPMKIQRKQEGQEIAKFPVIEEHAGNVSLRATIDMKSFREGIHKKVSHILPEDLTQNPIKEQPDSESIKSEIFYNQQEDSVIYTKDPETAVPFTDIILEESSFTEENDDILFEQRMNSEYQPVSKSGFDYYSLNYNNPIFRLLVSGTTQARQNLLMQPLDTGVD